MKAQKKTVKLKKGVGREGGEYQQVRETSKSGGGRQRERSRHHSPKNNN